MAIRQIRNQVDLTGLSTDTKPTKFGGEDIGAGSTFWEANTDNKYKYDGNSWNKISISGAALVTDGIQGVARNRFISVTTNTLPTLAGSGCATFISPGVKGITIDSVRVVSGTLLLTANADYTVRYAIDAANDAAAAILVPLAAPTSSATADAGQVRSFCLTPIFVPDTEAAGDLRVGQLILPAPVYIDVSDGILRLDFVHQIGTAVVLQFGISAVEEV